MNSAPPRAHFEKNCRGFNPALYASLLAREESRLDDLFLDFRGQFRGMLNSELSAFLEYGQILINLLL